MPPVEENREEQQEREKRPVLSTQSGPAHIHKCHFHSQSDTYRQFALTHSLEEERGLEIVENACKYAKNPESHSQKTMRPDSLPQTENKAFLKCCDKWPDDEHYKRQDGLKNHLKEKSERQALEKI